MRDRLLRPDSGSPELREGAQNWYLGSMDGSGWKWKESGVEDLSHRPKYHVGEYWYSTRNNGTWKSCAKKQSRKDTPEMAWAIQSMVLCPQQRKMLPLGLTFLQVYSDGQIQMMTTVLSNLLPTEKLISLILRSHIIHEIFLESLI